MAERTETSAMSWSTKDLETFCSSRHEAIGPAWDQYVQGAYATADAVISPVLELLSDEDVDVTLVRRGGLVVDFSVQVCGAKTVNVMGFVPAEECAVFRGQIDLLNRFIDFVFRCVGTRQVTTMARVAQVLQPSDHGLPTGMSYSEFAREVEILEYIMWHESVNESDGSRELLSLPATPRASESTGDRHSDSGGCSVDTTSQMDTRSSPAGTRSVSEDVVMHDSSSPLSPPPELLETPPSLKKRLLESQGGMKSL